MDFLGTHSINSTKPLRRVSSVENEAWAPTPAESGAWGWDREVNSSLQRGKVGLAQGVSTALPLKAQMDTAAKLTAGRSR